MVLLSSSRGQPRARATACSVEKNLWDLTDQQLKRRQSTVGSGFFIWSHGLWKRHCPAPYGITLFKLFFISVYIIESVYNSGFPCDFFSGLWCYLSHTPSSTLPHFTPFSPSWSVIFLSFSHHRHSLPLPRAEVSLAVAKYSPLSDMSIRACATVFFFPVWKQRLFSKYSEVKSYFYPYSLYPKSHVTNEILSSEYQAIIYIMIPRSWVSSWFPLL